jgi:hypothetical protein
LVVLGHASFDYRVHNDWNPRYTFDNESKLINIRKYLIEGLIKLSLWTNMYKINSKNRKGRVILKHLSMMETGSVDADGEKSRWQRSMQIFNVSIIHVTLQSLEVSLKVWELHKVDTMYSNDIERIAKLNYGL